MGKLLCRIFGHNHASVSLEPITSDPAEWNDVGPGVWQSRREPATFSEDGGKTWYNLDDPEKKNFPARHL